MTIGSYTITQTNERLLLFKEHESGKYLLAIMAFCLILPVLNLIRRTGLLAVNLCLILVIAAFFIALTLNLRRASKTVSLEFDRQRDGIWFNGQQVAALSALKSVRLDRLNVGIVRSEWAARETPMTFWILKLGTLEGKDISVELGQGEYDDMKKIDQLVAQFTGAHGDLPN